MKTLLLIDFHNTMIRSLMVNKELSHNGEYTGGLYGVLAQIIAAIPIVKPDEILVCKDKKPYLREKYFPQFKKDREEHRPNGGFDFYTAHKQNTASTLELFQHMEVPVWEIEGLEADDLIAFAVDTFIPLFDRIVILSNDSDLNQLLFYHNVFFYRNKQLFGVDDFKEKYDIDPLDWVDYTVMVGTHNGIPGVKGIGPKTAAKIIKDRDKFIELEQKYGSDFSKKRDLIILPFPYFIGEVHIPTPRPFASNIRPLIRFAESKGITFTMKMAEAF